MSCPLETILTTITAKNPAHAQKLKANLASLHESFKKEANAFFNTYKAYLEKQAITLEYSVDCYLHLLEDMIQERYQFIYTGHYSNTSFEEVEKRIYGNPEIMKYHMHGLVLAQFLWFDQYERFLFFKQNLKKHIKNRNSYLEIGGGHGLFIGEALKLLPDIKRFDMVDISQSSLDLAKGIINTPHINYYLKDIFDFSENETYDFITVGEVIEHVENPLQLLKKIKELLSNEGVCYMTTPINAPMIDHIYLFSNENEIRDIVYAAGFEILEEKIVISEKITKEQAIKNKVPIMYASFLKKKNK
ncbi:class I SAM-dependent methyltransferase [Dokdonia ponticola]|uniref:Class I SAM-dependent methyltransferase n=1 Tax=Dokdonia ponticola TaxID=2041041 RepID=A0ABV9HUM4_9FLAO